MPSRRVVMIGALMASFVPGARGQTPPAGTTGDVPVDVEIGGQALPTLSL
jgi:hypothetical protein